MSESEERTNASQYGSIERVGPNQATSDLPPKPAVRQRTLTRQHQNKQQQDLCDEQQQQQQQVRRKSSNSSDPLRDELNRELQAELGRKLSLARSRLEQSEQLEQQQQQQAAAASNHHDPQQSIPSTKKKTDLSLCLSMDHAEHKPTTIDTADQDHRDDIKDCTQTRPYPKKVFFIIANEFCERFSYYGLRAVLVMYLSQVLKFSDSNATITFHLFAMLCYVTPILGAILGDSVCGKFKTILYLSVVYFLGELILVLSSVFWNHGQPSTWSTFAGLVLIGVGTGGIKPCVSALGGDQFMAHEEKWRQSFFSLFYAAINLGSLLTMYVTPLLRTEFQCVNRQDCFPYAFGLPCALMFVSIVVFLLAKNQYYLAPLPTENVIVSFCKCIWIALKRKLTGRRPEFVLDDNLAIVGKQLPVDSSSISASSSSSSSGSEEASAHLSSAQLVGPVDAKSSSSQDLDMRREEDSTRRSHWLYLAADRFDSRSIEAFRSVLGILLLFIPTLVYWCLFDQQGSLWTFQATRMDGHLFGSGGRFVMQPDQMGVANPLILLAVIPVFEVIIYPSFRRCNLLNKPLQRMTIGGFVAALAFLASAAIELRIQQFTPPNEPAPGSANLILVNGLRECSLVHPTISHIPMPDVLASVGSPLPVTTTTTNPFFSVDNSNQTLAALAAGALAAANHGQLLAMSMVGVSSLEALAAQSVDVQSANSSTLNNYQLKLRLADSQEQMKSNKSFGCPISQLDQEFSFAPLPDRSTRMLYLELGNGRLTYKLFNESLELPASSKARVRLLYEFFGSSSLAERRQFHLQPAKPQSGPQQDRKSFASVARDGQVLLSDYVDIEVPSAGAQFSLESDDPKLKLQQSSHDSSSVFLEPGTRNLLILHQSDAQHVWLKHQVLQDNKYRISMLYQLVPYTLISMSEVMFSITGLEFSYAMAPTSMKSVLLAIWSLTIAFGNLLTVFVESLHLFSNVAHEFAFYAGLMAADMCVFAVMGYYFRPNKYHGK